MDRPFDFDDGVGANTASLGDYLSVFSRRAWLVVIPFVLIVCVAGMLGFLLPAQYEASTLFEVEDTTELEVAYQGIDVSTPHKKLLTTVSQVIKTRKFSAELIAKNGINEGYDTTDRKELIRLYQRVFKRLIINLVARKEGPDVIEIRYTGRDAGKVTNFVNDVRIKYIKYILEKRRDTVAELKRDLEARHKLAARELETAGDAYQDFQENHPYELIGDKKLAEARIELSERRNQQAELTIELEGKEKQLDRVRTDLQLENPYREGGGEKILNPDFTRQAGVVAELRSELKGRLEHNTELHPQVKELREKINIEDERLKDIPEFRDSRVVQVINKTHDDLRGRETGLEAEIEGIRAKIALIRKDITRLEAAEKEIPRLNRQERDLAATRQAALTREEQIRRKLLNVRGAWVRVNSEDAQLFENIKVPLPDWAEDSDPVFPNVPIFVGVGAFIGLLVGSGLAFLVEFTSSSFVTVRQIQRTVPLPVLGQVQRIESVTDVRTRRYRRAIAWILLLLLVSALAYVHICYFNKELRGNLPTWLYQGMKRFYGAE